MRPHHVFLFRWSTFPKSDANKGVRVNETKRLSKVENTTTNENCRTRFPTNPDVSAIGMNTTKSTMVMATAVKPISCLPSMAARTLFFHFKVAKYVFQYYNTVINQNSDNKR